MRIYILIWIIGFLLSLKEIFSKKQTKSKILLFFYFFLLTIITGIRYKNGTDYDTYSIIFNNIKSMADYRYIEAGFRFITALTNKFFNYNYNYMVFSIINFYFLYKAVKKLKYPIFSTFIYVNIFFFPYSFNGIRQGLAMSVYAFIIFGKFDKLSRIIYYILGILFHKIMITIFILTEIIKKIKIRIDLKLGLTIFTSFILFSKYFVLFASKFIPKLRGFILVHSHHVLSINGIILRIILLSLISYFLYSNDMDRKMRNIYKIYVMGFLFYGLFINQYLFSTRINMFFRILELYLIPEVFYKIEKKRNKLILFLIIVGLYGGLYLKEMKNESNFPYKVNPYFLEKGSKL